MEDLAEKSNTPNVIERIPLQFRGIVQQTNDQ